MKGKIQAEVTNPTNSSSEAETANAPAEVDRDGTIALLQIMKAVRAAIIAREGEANPNSNG